jgi:gliding motility-associated-like protein
LAANLQSGTPPYAYGWSNLDSNRVATGLAAGTYALTVTDAQGCTVSLTNLVVNQPDTLIGEAVVTDPRCFGQSNGRINARALGGNPPYNFLWADSNFTGSDIRNLPAGIYPLIVSDSKGCTDTLSIEVSQPDSIFSNLPDTLVIELGDDTVIVADFRLNHPFDASYEWSPGDFISCTDCAEPEVDPIYNTVYTVEVNDSGCYLTDSVVVIVDPIKPFYIPNAFSPNGDGNNDVFEVLVRDKTIKRLMYQVYDRWGEKVFETDQIGNGWTGEFKGRAATSGSYVYYVYVEYIDLVRESYTGSLLLVR